APALRGLGARGSLVGRMVCAAYGYDILAAADARRLPRPAHRPLLLSVIGDADLFDWRATWRAWRHFADGARPLRTPARAPGQRAWFVLAPGRSHPPTPGDILAWPELVPVIEQFFERVLSEAEQRDARNR
ncbi:MAG: hypothetical protein H0W72_14635, partial [Planctomycetes bacterium]|nr:hypothetical protein [Planctomycetota bacterium]